MQLFLNRKVGACGPGHVKFSAGKGLDEMAMLMPAERERLSVHLSCSAISCSLRFSSPFRHMVAQAGGRESERAAH